ncbi:CCCH zinc finger and SMR domain containing protein [Pseudohyphozyma bogoriensis]|nr:CCCH zinc finger and SMR domain containing protein [Pseudohyphozyma bogoriensis]
MATIEEFGHTKALLSYLFATYPSASLATLSLDDSSASSTASTSPRADSVISAKSTHSLDASKFDPVLELLKSDEVDDDDKPDELKKLLESLLDTSEFNLDPQILSLLHRYHEDLHPSGNPVPPLPNAGSSTPLTSISRSSSFRRTFSSQQTPLTTTSRVAPSSSSSSSRSSAPNSPFRAASPALSITKLPTPQHSPWSSPRPTPLSLNLALSANAPEFKFSAGASEFTPGGSSNTGSAPGTPLRSMSPAQAAQSAQQQWMQNSSPLGTPKTGTAPGHSGTSSALSSPSYFPRHLEAGVRHGLMNVKKPRLPWADTNDESSNDDDWEEGEDLGEGERRDEGDEWGELQYQVGAEYGAGVPTGGWDPFGEGEEYGADSNAGGAGQEGYWAPEEGGLGAAGSAYVYTPFDHLHSVFAGSDVSSTLLEEALVMCGWDVDSAIEYIIDQQNQLAATGGLPPMQMMDGGMPPQGPPGAEAFPPLGGGGALTPTQPFPPHLQQPQPRTVGASGSRPLIVSRDSFDGFTGGNGGRGSLPGPRWGSRPQTPTGERGVGGRVCRYYLSGNCLRSDCKFSHDVGKAVCKFWLRGHCLKGDGRCDFLHSIPPIMRADFEQRARQRSAMQYGQPELILDDSGPDLDFPTLGEMPRSRRHGGMPQHRNVQLDPTRTRFSGAVKFGSRSIPGPPLSRTLPPPPVPTRDMLPQPKQSVRIALRPPALLPTLPTGAALAQLYSRYRTSFLQLGANRNKCLAKAAECWKRGDGAGARKFSRDAADWNRQVAIEGRDSANKIVEERKKLMREAILNNEGGRAGTTDDVADRRARGQERGGGICLGVVSQAILPRGRLLSAEERTEVALDLHGLHADEAVSFLGEFLLSLEREHFPGLAFVVIGEAKHTGASDKDRGAAAGRLRLEQACTEFLSDQGWPWSIRSGIICIDALR